MWAMERWGNTNNCTQTAQALYHLLTGKKMTWTTMEFKAGEVEAKILPTVLKHQTTACPTKISSFLGAIFINAFSWL